MTPEEIAALLIRRFEGFYSKPYLCPAGVPTIGYGFTHYADGTPVTLNDAPMTREYAERLLLALVRRDYLPRTQRLIPQAEGDRLGAMTDFSYNLGVGTLRNSTLRKKIVARLWDEVPEQLRRWTRGGGRVLRGLVARREAEIAYL